MNCQLLAPPPSIVFDMIHPSFIWGIGALLLVRCGYQVLRLEYGKPVALPTMTRGVARWLALLAMLCMVAAVCYLTFVAGPSEIARGQWLMQEQAALPPECVSAVVEPANATAVNAGFAPFLLLVMLPVGISELLFWVARFKRGLRRRVA